MPLYHRLGSIPAKRHQVFRKPDGSIYFEQLVGNKGFVGPSSLQYHIHPPTEVLKVTPKAKVAIEHEPEPGIRHRHFRTASMGRGASVVLDRVPLLFNDDVSMWTVQPTDNDEFFYRNGQADELVYVTEGSGTLESQFGTLPIRSGDYVVIPRGIVHRWRLAKSKARLVVFESRGYVRTPKRYRNEHGQLLEGSPFNERDLGLPQELPVHDEKGEFPILVKQNDQLTEYVLAHHPFDAVGWDGYYFPYTLNIDAFEPKVARFHLPPPVHQTFEGDGFVICSFCPRPFDFDEEAVPAPYFHSNAMSDEVLYYASSEFMSRKGIEYGSITLHPDGIPHGPHPGRMEDSIGVKWTDELAVMLDTFRPLRVARPALSAEDSDYFRSWIE